MHLALCPYVHVTAVFITVSGTNSVDTDVCMITYVFYLLLSIRVSTQNVNFTFRVVNFTFHISRFKREICCFSRCVHTTNFTVNFTINFAFALLFCWGAIMAPKPQ